MRVEIVEGRAARELAPDRRRALLSPYLERYGGGAFSYATLQDGLDYLVAEGLGYLAFVTVRHPVFAPLSKRIVLGDPVCAPERTAELVRIALESNPRLVLAPVSEPCAAALRPLGFKANCVGWEPEIPIREYDTRGDWRERDFIRRARNEARRSGVTIREEDLDRVDRAELEAISRRWLERKPVHDREIWVYARRPVYAREEDVRDFVARDRDGRVAGFVFYDPIYEGGEAIGYSANISRCDEERFGKLSVAINLEAIDRFKEEGKRVLNLCIAPFDRTDRGAFNDDGVSRIFYRLLRRYGGLLYNFGGLSFHKARYRGREKLVYFVTNGLMPANDLYLAFHSSLIVRSYAETIGKLALGMWRALRARRDRAAPRA